MTIWRVMLQFIQKSYFSPSKKRMGSHIPFSRIAKGGENPDLPRVRTPSHLTSDFFFFLSMVCLCASGDVPIYPRGLYPIHLDKDIILSIQNFLPARKISREGKKLLNNYRHTCPRDDSYSRLPIKSSVGWCITHRRGLFLHPWAWIWIMTSMVSTRLGQKSKFSSIYHKTGLKSVWFKLGWRRCWRVIIAFLPPETMLNFHLNSIERVDSTVWLHCVVTRTVQLPFERKKRCWRQSISYILVIHS
jgi:hypothetical protein